jgi:glucose-6-phosphate isomerase
MAQAQVQTTHDIRLDSEAGEGLVVSQVAPAHVAETADALEGIHAEFLREQEAGLPLLERRWRAWTVSHLQNETIEATVALAERARREFAAFLLLGIGGSDLAPRVVHDCLDDPCQEMVCPADRGGALEVYFAGDTFDPRSLAATHRCLRIKGLMANTLVNVVSRSGKTPETVAATEIVGQWLEEAGVTPWRKHAVATTVYEESSILYQAREQFYGLLPVPAGVGGRFSVASPVGLFTLAMAADECVRPPGTRVSLALEGFRRGHELCFDLAPGEPGNVAFRLAKWLHLAERCTGKTSLVFYNYADDRYLGDWLTQLVTESIQERGEGLNVIGTRGPTGNHSLLNGLIRGPRDKVVVFVQWADLEPELRVPTGTGLTGELAELEGLPLGRIQAASYRGTAAEFTANGIPNVTLVVPRRDERCLFQLMRILMDTVAIKGRLQLLHCTADGRPNWDRELTYQQDGVEGYKERTREELGSIRRQLGL